jgi:endonuclease-3
MKKIGRIILSLEAEYGKRRFESSRRPLDELIITILSQNTSWQNTKRAFDNLRKNFRDWRELMQGSTARLKKAISPGGLANLKAPRIKQILRQIYNHRGRLSLDFLARMDTPEAFRFLTSFKGIGPKTAYCVLLFSFKRAVLPVDTHILRVAKRLGLLDEKISSSKAHEILGKLIPGDRNKMLSFHVNMIEHGRKICKAARPLCPACRLKSMCDYFSKGRYYKGY